MNRIKIAVIILASAISLSVFSLYYVTCSCEKMIKKLDKVISYTLKEDISSAKKMLDSAVNDYERYKPFFNILLGQGDTLEIRSDLNKSIFFINLKNKDSAVLYLEECKMDLNRIIVSYTPSVSTIL